MEPSYHEESINSSEEVMDHSDQENNDAGVGRSYECVFCRRGFNTAQALGGHMNIHRKDRARNKPNSNKQEEICYTDPRLYQQIPSHTNNNQSPNRPHEYHQPIFSYATYFPESTSSNSRSSLYGSDDHYHLQNDLDPHRRQPSNPLIHGDWRMSLSLEFPPAIIEDLEKNQEKDLDLELRLGSYDS